MGQERRSFGSIERRSGYFRARYVGPDRQRYEAPNLFSDRIDAEFWLGEVHRSISCQEWRPPVEVKGQPDDLDTLAGYARHCLAERELTPRTREEYGRLLEKLIAPTLGSFKLKYLEPDQIRRWYSTVLSADRPVQRKHAYSLLRSILREAEDEGLIDRNPCRVRNAGKVRRTRDIEPATPAELNQLLELPAKQGLPVVLAGWCGLRSGEVRGLRRRDLDLTEGVVRVRQAVTRTKGQVHVGAPKTAAGVRDVGIPPHLIPYLAKYVAALPVTGRDGFLFPGGDGVSPMSEKALRYAYGQGAQGHRPGGSDLPRHAALGGVTGGHDRRDDRRTEGDDGSRDRRDGRALPARDRGVPVAAGREHEQARGDLRPVCATRSSGGRSSHPWALHVRIGLLLRLKGLRKEITMELQRYESLAQAAERTGISRKTLRRRIASGQLPVFSSGRRILRVRPEDVDAMLRPFWLG